jgi:heme a synthase
MAASAAWDAGAAGSRAGQHEAALRLWLWCLVALVVAMVAVGGATRLTGSGLSITEWKPVTGAIPPLSELAWAEEFARYRQIPQYELLNRGMTLAEFKTIYWWEWGHRQLGRFLGLAFFIPLLFFAWSGTLRGRRLLACLALGALGGLQAAVGWIMVASGLEPGMTAVAPLKLTIHLTLASVILAGLAFLATRASGEWVAAPPAARTLGTAFLLLVLVQIALGGLVAGSKAGLTYNTWPLMDGRLVPPAETLFAVRPLVENWIDNVALVQFNHRLGAYLLVLFALVQAWRLRRTIVADRAALLAALVLGQAALGVATLLLAVPLWAGLAHQLAAMVILVAATEHRARLA